MILKRFNRVGGYVYDGDKCISHFEDVAHRDDIVKLLNELHEENQELKQQLQNTSDQRDEFHRGARENANRVGKLEKENEQLKFENNELKCALALDEVDYIIADGKKIDIPPYYEFEQRYDFVMHRREYDGYD